MKQLLEILAVLSLATASGTLGFVNQINQKNISDQQKDQTDIKDLFAGKLFLGSFLTPEEAKNNAENLLKVAKLSGKVKLGEPINGQIHVTATDKSLTGEVNLTYHIIQDIQEILKNNLDLGYASSDSDAKINAAYNLEKAKIRNKVILGEPSEGKIHVQADFPSLKGEADFVFKISQEIDKLLAGKTNLDPVKNDADAQDAGQEVIDGLNLKDKVKLDTAMDGKIKVIPIHSSLRGYATFTYSIIPRLSSIITNTNLGILENAKKETILARVKDLNPEAKNKVEVKSIGQEKKSAVIIANNPQEYQGTVNVQFEAKMDRVPVNPPKDIPVILTKTTKKDPVLNSDDVIVVQNEVVKAMQAANADRVYGEQTFKVDASKLAPTADKISIKVEATESTLEKPGLIADDHFQVRLNLITAEKANPSKKIVLDLKETTDEELIHGGDVDLVHDAIIDGMKEANEGRVYDENTFTVDVKGLTPKSTLASVHVNATTSTVNKPGLIEGDIEVSLQLTGVIMEIVANLSPDTIFSKQTSTLHVDNYFKYKNLKLDYDRKIISIDNFDSQGEAEIKSLQNETERVVVPIEISADNATTSTKLSLIIKPSSEINAKLDNNNLGLEEKTNLRILNARKLENLKVEIEGEQDVISLTKKNDGLYEIVGLKKGHTTIKISASNVAEPLILDVSVSNLIKIQFKWSQNILQKGQKATLTILNIKSLHNFKVEQKNNQGEIGEVKIEKDPDNPSIYNVTGTVSGDLTIQFTADNARTINQHKLVS